VADLHLKPRILIVDDEALIAVMLQDYLDELNCAVAGPCATVPDALALIARFGKDGLQAAILDVSLAGGSTSFPIADRLKELGIPYAFATGHGPDSIDPNHGSAPHLAKPFVFADVSKLIDAWRE